MLHIAETAGEVDGFVHLVALTGFGRRIAFSGEGNGIISA